MIPRKRQYEPEEQSRILDGRNAKRLREQAETSREAELVKAANVARETQEYHAAQDSQDTREGQEVPQASASSNSTPKVHANLPPWFQCILDGSLLRLMTSDDPHLDQIPLDDLARLNMVLRSINPTIDIPSDDPSVKAFLYKGVQYLVDGTMLYLFELGISNVAQISEQAKIQLHYALIELFHGGSGESHDHDCEDVVADMHIQSSSVTPATDTTPEKEIINRRLSLDLEELSIALGGMCGV
ncbi:hypothetical protein HYFRA_00001991 [Hymenoscyphus fraxineus]|uniref:Uncharacterized protein n=1 Tax=Hymenoscyphus fraxineus TaxID=746836 RepID=A0A9N9KLI1_9HELO|nr:hypothetical protein HYFRA_00001991 [Hymenoscyphus fraxineus]